MSDSPIKFPSSPSSSEDELLSHHSSEKDVSSDWMPSDCSPPWSSEEEDPEEEEEDEDKDEDTEDDADTDADDDDDNNSEPLTLTSALTRLLPSERSEHDPLLD
jgi:hypothetical protein